jgi:hypothetical protein
VTLLYFICRSCHRANAVEEESLYAMLDDNDECHCFLCHAKNKPLDPVRASETASEEDDLIIN